MEPSSPLFFPMPISQKNIQIEGDEIGQKRSGRRGTRFYRSRRCTVWSNWSSLFLALYGASVFIRLNLDLVLSLMVNLWLFCNIIQQVHIVSSKGGALCLYVNRQRNKRASMAESTTGLTFPYFTESFPYLIVSSRLTVHCKLPQDSGCADADYAVKDGLCTSY